MFEKEAKKWVKEHTEIEYKASYGEFPKEPSAMKSFKAGAEFGYNTANEWHYPSKGEYPSNRNDILCQIDFETSEVGYFNETYNSFFTIDGKEIKVRAWKEIVLSKESEQQWLGLS